MIVVFGDVQFHMEGWVLVLVAGFRYACKAACSYWDSGW